MKALERKIRTELQIAKQEHYFGKRDADHRRLIDSLSAQLTEYTYTGYAKERVESQYRTREYWLHLLEMNFEAYSRLVCTDHRSFVADYIFRMEMHDHHIGTVVDQIMSFYMSIANMDTEFAPDVAPLSPFLVNMDCWTRNLVLGSDLPYFMEEFQTPMYIGMDTFLFDTNPDEWAYCPVTSNKQLRSLMLAVSDFLALKDIERGKEKSSGGYDFPSRI